MHYQNIANDRQLLDYCAKLASCRSIAFDTEFVSEHTYRPVLCLVQVSADGELAIIDSMTIDDMNPFWETLAAPGHETIVHSGRGEVEFSLQAIGRAPVDLFDVQIAGGFAGIEYPAGFATLVAKVLGKPPAKHETRTDWRRRPLSQRQIDYALEDAYYLQPLRDALRERLAELGRLEWLAEEMGLWLDEVQRAFNEERWRKVASNVGLDPRAQAIVRELSLWRDREAQRRNQPVRRVLRDDLIIELARRQTDDIKRIRAVRGMERGDLQRRLDEIAESIRRGISMPEEQCPAPEPRQRAPQLAIVGQLLYAALGNVCRQAHLAPNMAGTANDIRDLVIYNSRQWPDDRPKPRLASGWREKFVGNLFEDLLSGKTSIRIGDATSDFPLVFEKK
jgi:ribonuclease D